jgi:hypothetical protein
MALSRPCPPTTPGVLPQPLACSHNTVSSQMLPLYCVPALMALRPLVALQPRVLCCACQGVVPGGWPQRAAAVAPHRRLQDHARGARGRWFRHLCLRALRERHQVGCYWTEAREGLGLPHQAAPKVCLRAFRGHEVGRCWTVALPRGFRGCTPSTNLGRTPRPQHAAPVPAPPSARP